MRKILLLLSVIIFVAGCTSLPSDNMKTEMSAFKKEGMIAGTLSLEDKRLMSSYTLRYVQIAGPPSTTRFSDMLNAKTDDFVGNAGAVKFGYNQGDVQDGGKDIYLFNIVQPAGKYRIVQLDIFHNSGSQMYQYFQSVPMDITFDIEEGKTKYLGEINIAIKAQVVRMLDKIDRDRVLFRQRIPGVKF